MKCQFCLLGMLLFLGCTTKEYKNYITNGGPADWQPPVLTWQSLPDAEVRGTVGLDVTVTDSSAISKVKLYVDGAQRDSLTATPYRFSLHTDSLSDGVHLCEARAWDQYGNLGVSPILRVDVMNSVAQGPRLLWVPDSFATIQAAINASEDFDTIRVRDGTYYETLNTFGKGVWLESEHGPLRCTVSGLNSWNTILVAPSGIPAMIRGFALTGSQVVVRYDDGAQAILANCVIASDTAWSLLLTGSVGGRIVNNLFSGTGSDYSAVQLAYFWGVFENNILTNASTEALYDIAINYNPVVHSYNCFWNNGSDYGRFAAGTGEFHADPKIDLVSGTLLAGSPCVDTGDSTIDDLNGTRSDIGPFGGPWAYQ